MAASLIVTSANAANLDEVRTLFNAGEIRAARQLLLESPWAGTPLEWETWNLLLMPAGDSLENLGNELLAGELPAEFRALVVATIAKQHLATRNFAAGLEVISRWETECREAVNYPEVLFTRAQIRQEMGEGKKSRNELKQVIQTATDAGLRLEAALLLGDVELSRGRLNDAAAYYSRVAQVSELQLRPLALERLRNIYEVQNEFAEAQLVESVLNSCCRGYGVNSPTVFATTSSPKEISSAQLETTGTFRGGQEFAIRVGAFDDEATARKLHNRFIEQGYTSRLLADSRTGQTVYLVDIGRFASISSAARFMNRLARQNNDTYSIVSR